MAPGTVGVSLTSRSGSGEGAGASSGAADGQTGGRPGSAVADQRAALHRKLAQAARTCYPRAARRFRLKGTSRIHFCLDGSGSAGQVDLVESSGAALLDRAAQECVVPGAQPLPGTGCYTLGVEFTAP
jgi:TonB family protein